MAVPLTVEEYFIENISSINQRLDWLSKIIKTIYAYRRKLYAERLDTRTPEEAKTFSVLLHNMLPRIKLIDLLLEVANWTIFHEQCIHASTNKSPH